MGQHGMTSYYSEKLGKGMEYQDFLIKPLIQHGLVFQQYASKRYQQEKGESFNGIEVKYDMRMAETGNAYIEVAEKSNPNNAEYIKSGIFRDDNTILYVIGDYRYCYVLSKSHLRNIVKSSPEYQKAKGIRKVQTPTSIGYLFPEPFLDVWCVTKIDLSGYQ